MALKPSDIAPIMNNTQKQEQEQQEHLIRQSETIEEWKNLYQDQKKKMKTLQSENTNLKTELEKLKAQKSQDNHEDFICSKAEHESFMLQYEEKEKAIKELQEERSMSISALNVFEKEIRNLKRRNAVFLTAILIFLFVYGALSSAVRSDVFGVLHFGRMILDKITSIPFLVALSEKNIIMDKLIHIGIPVVIAVLFAVILIKIIEKLKISYRVQTINAKIQIKEKVLLLGIVEAGTLIFLAEIIPLNVVVVFLVLYPVSCFAWIRKDYGR